MKKTRFDKNARSKRTQQPQQRIENTARANLYGFHAVREAWLNDKRRIEAAFITEQAMQGFEETLKDSQDKGLQRPAPQIIDKQQMARMLPEGAVHQGVAVKTSELPEYDLKDLIIKVQDQDAPLFLMLDQVTDPHNVGAIIRSACAFGAAGVICQKKHAPELGGVLAKTACGALEHVPVAFVTNLSRALEEMQSEGYFAYGLDERGEIDVGALAKKPGKTVLVLGAEGPGLRPNVKNHCDGLVRLPMSGAMPSINVSNAAAVALYALQLGG